jgi:hypothetical protein
MIRETLLAHFQRGPRLRPTELSLASSSLTQTRTPAFRACLISSGIALEECGKEFFELADVIGFS